MNSASCDLKEKVVIWVGFSERECEMRSTGYCLILMIILIIINPRQLDSQFYMFYN